MLTLIRQANQEAQTIILIYLGQSLGPPDSPGRKDGQRLTDRAGPAVSLLEISRRRWVFLDGP